MRAGHNNNVEGGGEGGGGRTTSSNQGGNSFVNQPSLVVNQSSSAAAEELTRGPLLDLIERGKEPLQPVLLVEFDVFLSHRQVDAADFCALLYDKLVGRGLKVFLDRKYTGSLHDLPRIVANSKCFVFVLSNDIFSSNWCLLELHAAVRANVPCVPLRLDGAMWENRKFPDVDASYIPTTIDDADGQPIDVKPLLNHLFKTKAIEHSRDYFDAFFELLMSHFKKILEVDTHHSPLVAGKKGPFLIYHLWANTLLDEFGNKAPALQAAQVEGQYLKEIFAKVKQPICFRSTPATSTEIKYGASSARIVHFSGHGFKIEGEGNEAKNDCLAFEYDHRPFNVKMGWFHRLSVKDIMKINQDFKPELLCILACHSEEMGRAFLTLGSVKHVMAIKRFV
jgi:hypothetical protein